MGFVGGAVDALGDGASSLDDAATELRDVPALLGWAAPTMSGSSTGPAAEAAARFCTTYAALGRALADQAEALATVARASAADLAAATGQRPVTRGPGSPG